MPKTNKPSGLTRKRQISAEKNLKKRQKKARASERRAKEQT